MIPNRIALVAGGLRFGGTTTFCMFLAKGLRELGSEAKVFSFTSYRPMDQDFRALGLPVHYEDERKLIFEDRLVGVYQALRDFAPTAVFAVIGVEAFEVFRYLPKSVFRVAMLHDHLEHVYVQLPIYQPYYDHVAAVSAKIAQHVREHYPTVPCRYLQHGIFLNPPNRVRAPNPDKPLKLLYFGRFHEGSKGVRIFPRLWQELRRAKLRFRWTIHGCGEEEPYLRQHLAEAQKDGEVIFSQPLPHDQLGDLIRRHDVYLLTSKHEAGPLTLLEAMGYGLVPVCGDIPCLLQEVITPGNGFRVNPTEPAAYVEAISRLHDDRARLEAMSLAARQTVESGFSEMAMARRYLQFIEECGPQRGSVEWPSRIRAKPVLHMPRSGIMGLLPLSLLRILKSARASRSTVPG